MHSSHYSYAQNPKSLNAAAEWIVDNLVSKFAGYHYIIGYSGMSGISIATMVSLHLSNRDLDFSMFYVRKAGETLHGCPREYNKRIIEVINNPEVQYVCTFVDDFISTGKTMDSVKTAFIDEFDHISDIIFTNALTGPGNEFKIFTRDSVHDGTGNCFNPNIHEVPAKSTFRTILDNAEAQFREVFNL